MDILRQSGKCFTQVRTASPFGLWLCKPSADSSETKNEFEMKLAASLLAVIVYIEMHEEMIFTFEGP